MPILRIKIDGTVVVAVPTDQYEAVTARIGGTRDDEEFADLSVTSGTYRLASPQSHLVWVDAVRLSAGQTVEFQFADQGVTVGAGKPFDLQQIADAPMEGAPEESLHQLANWLREQPWVRAPYRLQYGSSRSARLDYALAPTEYGFGLSALWSDLRPGRLSVSLHAYTIDSIERQEGGRDLVAERLAVGECCRVVLVA